MLIIKISNSLGGDCKWKISNTETTVEATLPKELYAARASKSFQDFIKVLSQIIEKHGADVLDEISRVGK